MFPKPSSRRWFLIGALAVVLALGLLESNDQWHDSWRETTAAPKSEEAHANHRKSAPAAASGGHTTELAGATPADNPFRAWLADYRALPADARERVEQLRVGLKLAKERRGAMEKLIRENPRRALAESLRFDEWHALPDELKAETERPFSALASHANFPVCGRPGAARGQGEPTSIAVLTLPDGTDLRAFSYGRKEGVFSKPVLPVQGISLMGISAVRDGPLHILQDTEVAAVRMLFGDGQSDMDRSLVSGARVGPDAVFALSAGKVFVFNSAEEAQALDDELAQLDDLPGPWAASSFLAAGPAGAPGGVLNLPELERRAVAASSSWTETKKNVFLIRINFPDEETEPVTQEAAETVMERASERICEMSYGKTWVEARASANVYTMPQTLAYYKSSESRLFGELMRDARNTFRSTKSGADALIDIGPATEGAFNPFMPGSGLGDFDIVGLFRVPLPGEGGAAGGADLFMMANDEGIFVHEWGHNYGLGHASWWKTTDGSVAGEGTNDEGGDPFDIMGSGRVPEGHFNHPGKVRLNWLPADRWTEVSAPGTYHHRIYRVDDTLPASGLCAVRVPRGGSAAQHGYYWIGHRGAWAENPRLSSSAYLLWGRPDPYRSWLLDTTPGSAALTTDSTLALGATFADPLSEVFITPLSGGRDDKGGYIDVCVNIGPFPGNAPPQVSEISGPVVVQARQPAIFSVTASDPNGDALAYGWETGEQTPKTAINSPVREVRWDTGGTYELKVTVSDMKGGQVTRTRQIQVNDPLDNWTSTDVGRRFNFVAAQAGHGLVVAAGYWGELFYSWDAIAWQESPVASEIENPRLAFGMGTFVAAGKTIGQDTARIAFSHDGRIWEIATVPEAIRPQAVAYGGGKFVAVGDAGTVLWSENGEDWNKIQVPEAPHFRFLAWNGNAWLATALNPGNDAIEFAWTSPDGLTWTARGSLGMHAGHIIGHRGTFLVMGWYSGIKFSVDHGVTWTRAAMPGGIENWSARQVALADDGTFFAHGIMHSRSNGDRSVALISPDGRSWSWSDAAASFGVLEHVGHDQLASGAGRFLRLGWDGDLKVSQPLSVANRAPILSGSTIGATAVARGRLSLEAQASDPDGDALEYYWDFGGSLPVLSGGRQEIILPFGGTYEVTLRVIDGKGAINTSSRTITVADPALAFTQRVSGALYTLNAIAANDSMVVAVGDANHPVLTSTDGVNWTTRTLPRWTYGHAIVWAGAKFVLAGHSWMNSGGGDQWHNTIFTSPDGLIWTERYAAVAGTQWLRALAAQPGGPILAGGDKGLLLQSPDGNSWAPQPPGALGESAVRALVWSGREFALLTDNNAAKLLTSTDGLQWIDRSAAASGVWTLAWLNDRHVATGWTGWNSYIRTSLDGARNFSTARFSDSVEFRAMTYGNGVYYGVGFEHVPDRPQVEVFSLNGNDWYSYRGGSANEQKGAAFFKDTIITVGDKGEIRQSGRLPASGDVLSFRRQGPVAWNGLDSAVNHGFLGPPGQKRILQFTSDLAQPWLNHGEIEVSPLGLFDATIRRGGDQRERWGQRMFFRLLPVSAP
jgi:hypothetical protein